MKPMRLQLNATTFERRNATHYVISPLLFRQEVEDVCKAELTDIGPMESKCRLTLLAMTATPSAADIDLLARENRRRQLAALAIPQNTCHSYKRLVTLPMKARRPRCLFGLKGSGSRPSKPETT